MAHAFQCPYCIDGGIQACLEKNFNSEQMMEAIKIAAVIRGGAFLVHRVQMRKIDKKLKKDGIVTSPKRCFWAPA